MSNDDITNYAKELIADTATKKGEELVEITKRMLGRMIRWGRAEMMEEIRNELVRKYIGEDVHE